MGPGMRTANWAEILTAEVNKARHTPFKWGEHDCCLFAANVVLAMTGKDYAEAFRGKYKTKRGAALALKRYGRGTLRDSIIGLLGDPVPPTLARRGDVILWVSSEGPTLGICFGTVGVFTGPEGIVSVPMSECCDAWRVD